MQSIDMYMAYVIVISWARGMYGIYCTEARGCLCPRVEVQLMPYVPSARDITSLYPEGVSTIATITVI